MLTCPPHRERQHHQHQQRHGLAARECGQADRRTQHGGPPGVGAVEESIGRDQHQGGGQREGGLAAKRPIGGHEHRVEGRQSCCDQSHPVASQPPAEKPDRNHRGGADQRARHLVGLPGAARDDREGRQQQRVQRRLVGRGHLLAGGQEGARRAVAVPVGQQVRDLVERQPVTQQRVVLYEQQAVGQPESER